ncbi:MAG: nucleotidyl transferase AbiEii/AbiGii toxin family protein [Endomicrobiaceae bacterium]|nr:nucleotidyl transferase AbiEii/AbiGii toxin family protein [Endomicrobiaceae bacterium]
MTTIEKLSVQERNDLFQYVANEKKIDNVVIVEKDFWICWVLSRIFSDDELKRNLHFKGGTSLSKIFNVIERFSEDIDLILNWDVIDAGKDLNKDRSVTQQGKINEMIESKAEQYISNELKSKIEGVFDGICSVSSDPEDKHILYVTYPVSFKGEHKYIHPKIKLEIGPLASWEPYKEYPINSYVSEIKPEFSISKVLIPTIEAERTFWEKATILHQEYHREKNTPPRYSRHYYDLFKMANSEIKSRAFENIELLKDVVNFKNKFYHYSWAKYEDAKPGTFHLYPSEHNLNTLKSDYKEMESMIFGNYPAWTDILESMKNLEKEINSLERKIYQYENK